MSITLDDKPRVGRRHLVPPILTVRSKIVILALTVSAIACRPNDRQTRGTAVKQTDTRPELADSSPSVASKPTLLTGPSIVIDSAVGEARLDRTSGQLMVHLSPQMGRALYDTLPGFAPLAQSTYGALRPSESESAYSVVVGDFDGDSLQDIVMLGTSRSSPVLFMLLANPDSSGRTIFLIEPATPPESGAYRLGLVSRQRLQSPDNKDYFVDLHADAVHLQSESVSAVCYLDHGTLRWFGLGGD
jgi:hypothetical protein